MKVHNIGFDVLLEGRQMRNTRDFNPSLRKEIGNLQGGMAAAAERIPVSKRFQFAFTNNQVLIRDTETGKTSTVGLCDYHGVRRLLADLFSEPERSSGNEQVFDPFTD